MKDLFISHLSGGPRSLPKDRLDALISPNLFSPFEIELPKSVLAQAREMVRACYHLREHQNYQKTFAAEIAKWGIKDPANKSICMSYDFHLDEQGQLKLIEINTNASFLALGCEMYQARKLPLPVADFDLSEIKGCIETELRLQGRTPAAGMKTEIIDEHPEQQKLFAEFLLFQSLFREWGWSCEIKNFDELSTDTEFVYNRYNDFYLSNKNSALLKERFLNRTACFSPNPFEYLLLADKQRMIDWNHEELWKEHQWPEELKDKILTCLPVTLDVTSEKAQEIWSERKKYFFKPKRAFGAKQSYRGESISKKMFDGLIGQDFIAQEFVPAPEIVKKTPEGMQAYKYDLRFYAYQDRVQMAVARVYQGQVTNLRTIHGGFAPILFI